MQVSTTVSISDHCYKVHDIDSSSGGFLYISIGQNSEIIIYPTGQSRLAQIRSAKRLFHGIWDELNRLDDEPELWDEDVSGLLCQEAVEEEIMDDVGL